MSSIIDMEETYKAVSAIEEALKSYDEIDKDYIITRYLEKRAYMKQKKKQSDDIANTLSALSLSDIDKIIHRDKGGEIA